MMSLTRLPLLNPLPRKRNPRPLGVNLLLPVEEGVENVENVVDGVDVVHHEVVVVVAVQEEVTLMRMVFVYSMSHADHSIQRPR